MAFNKWLVSRLRDLQPKIGSRFIRLPWVCALLVSHHKTLALRSRWTGWAGNQHWAQNSTPSSKDGLREFQRDTNRAYYD